MPKPKNTLSARVATWNGSDGNLNEPLIRRDYFQQLYEFAVDLIQKGLAYVCDMTKDETEAQRDLAMREPTSETVEKIPMKKHPFHLQKGRTYFFSR